MGKLITLPKNKKFEILNKNETSAEIIIYDEIGDYGISAKGFSEELKKIPSSVKNIDIRLNSPGGSVFDGISIFERLKQHKAKKTVYVDGLAASIASIIALAGDTVIMGEGALFMIHKPMCGIMGNSTELEKMINLLDKIEEQMISIYARKTGMGRAEIAAKLEAETWLNCDECISLGMADKVFKAEDSLMLVASAMDKGTKIFKNAPKLTTTNDIVKNKIQDLKKNIEGYLAQK